MLQSTTIRCFRSDLIDQDAAFPAICRGLLSLPLYNLPTIEYHKVDQLYAVFWHYLDSHLRSVSVALGGSVCCRVVNGVELWPTAPLHGPISQASTISLCELN